MKFLDVTFRLIFDAMHAVTGAYAEPIFVDKLGASPVHIASLLSSSLQMTGLQILSKFLIIDVIV